MSLDRRHFLTAVGAASVPFVAEHAVAAPLSILGVDALHFGVRAGSPDDQSRALQNAIDQAAGARVPLVLGPGVYRAGDLRLPSGAQIVGVRGATRLVLTRGPSLISGSAGSRDRCASSPMTAGRTSSTIRRVSSRSSATRADVPNSSSSSCATPVRTSRATPEFGASAISFPCGWP